MSHSHRCPRCQRSVEPVGGPSLAWKLALFGGILMTAGSLVSAFFVGMILMFLGPVYLTIACCIGPLYAFATDPATCPRCGSMVGRTA